MSPHTTCRVMPGKYLHSSIFCMSRVNKLFHFSDFLSRASIFKRKGMERNVNFLDLQWTSILFKGDSQSALFDQFTQLTDSMQFYYWQSLGLSISNPNQPKVKIYLGYKIIIIINCEHPHYVR